MKARLLVLFVCAASVQLVVGPPVDTRHPKEERKTTDQKLEDLGIEYASYLEQVVKVLEEDPDFIKKLENVTQDQIKSGDIADQLEYVKHSVRSKLDELKRMELDRLRDLARQVMEKNELGAYREPDGRLWRTLERPLAVFGDGMDRKGIKIPSHLDIRNPHSFEIDDLRKLMQTAGQDLEEIDKKRKEEFKEYEMDKEHRYREELRKMNEEEKKAAEAKHKEQTEKHKDHPRVHHPGSKQQLEQVWEEQDHMPKDEFDPDLFFSMHDINGDNHLDEDEVEAVLTLEIKKMYDSNHTEDDPVEMMEEYHRMRAHIYHEIDKNKDRLISREEFMDYTKRQDFERDEGWKGLDEQQIYTEEELIEFEKQRYQQMHGQEMAGQYQFAQHPGGNPQQPIHPGAQYQHVPQGQPQYQQQQGQPQFQGHPQQGQPQFQGHPQQGQPQYQGHPQQGQPQFQGHPQQGQPQFQGHPQQPQYHQQQPGIPQYQQGPAFQGAGAPPPYHPQGAQDSSAHHPPVPNQQAPTGQQNLQPPAAGNVQKNVNENKL